MIQVTRKIVLHEDEIKLVFIRSSGPGGQNVNKVASAVQLRFDAAASPSLPEEVRTRLMQRAGRQMTAEGELIITARRFRSQERNRQDAVSRLIELIRQAAPRPAPRRRTRPPAASRKRLRAAKRRHSEKKKLRRSVVPAHE